MVLRLLPSHRSYRGIGEELAVTVNTVKFHVQAIYRKLGVSNRAEAVERARTLGLIP
jgi:LuxR family maltose regulon positive regulatory protein